MTDLPPPKRRRLDVTSTLSKPFKPPLRKPTATATATATTIDPLVSPRLVPQTPEAPRVPNHESSLMAISPGSEASVGSCLSSPSISPVSHLRRPIPRYSGLSTPTRSPLGDPEVLALQRQQNLLRKLLTSFREELDLANQALRIESSTKDSELEALIIKWRRVSQEAADEVFEGARERVKRMGGMVAWREQSKQDTARWDFENENHGREDEDENEEQPSCSGNNDHAPDTAGQEEEFTMEYMLKMLNIDYKTVGFDVMAGKWMQK